MQLITMKLKIVRKTKSISKLKKLLDQIFSLFIRQFWANDDGMVACYTCGKILHWKEIQNGHFVPRQYLATRWDEDNCRPQCVGCNVFGGGKPLDFEDRLIREIGAEQVTALKAKRHQVLKLTPQWYEERIAYYKGVSIK